VPELPADCHHPAEETIGASELFDLSYEPIEMVLEKMLKQTCRDRGAQIRIR
jgi:hypothetical protein